MKVTSITNGVIIDHIPAGSAIKVLDYLHIDPSSTRLALIMNVPSNRMKLKDIIKIEGDVSINLDVLALVARSCTIDVVHDGSIVSKKSPDLPHRVVDVLACANPRCVTTTERGIAQVFCLDEQSCEYRCQYCDEGARI